jgi:hypothetical protein
MPKLTPLGAVLERLRLDERRDRRARRRLRDRRRTKRKVGGERRRIRQQNQMQPEDARRSFYGKSCSLAL